MLNIQIHRNIKEVERIHALKIKEWSSIPGFSPDNKNVSKDQENLYRISLAWLHKNWYSLSDEDISMKKTDLQTWATSPVEDIKFPSNYFDQEWKLRLSLDWEMFLQNFQRKYFCVPVGFLELFAKDFPFVSAFILGSLIIVVGNFVTELLFYVLNFKN